jgi:hypothetical protein
MYLEQGGLANNTRQYVAQNTYSGLQEHDFN